MRPRPQVDRIVSAYRGVLTVEQEVEQANRQVVEQYLRCDWDDDGSLVIHARVPAEIGALVLRALDTAREQLCADARGDGGPAGPVHRLASATNVDALHLVAESFMANGPAARSGADRHQLVVNVDEDVLIEDDLRTGSVSSTVARAWRRRPSDAWAVTRQPCVMVRRKDGTLLTATNKTQAIPQRVRRMLRARDQGCRFPGCGQRTFVDAHHVHHRAHGGSNELENLVELCWFHHRLVHEGGWKLRLDSAGNVVVTNPVGNVIPSLVALRGAAGDIEQRNRAAGIAIRPTTVTPSLVRRPARPRSHHHCSVVRRSAAPRSGLTGVPKGRVV